MAQLVLDFRLSHSSGPKCFSLVRLPTPSGRVHALFLSLLEEIGVDLIDRGVVPHTVLVDKNLCLVHVLLVAVEPVNARLQGLLAYELLHDEIVLIHGVLKFTA